MFRSTLTKSLWEYRIAILGWGLGLALFMFVGFAAATPTVITALASLTPILRFMGDAYAIRTPEGYIFFRYLGLVVPVMLSFWPILAGARLVRGEEERGTLDVVLATPQSRARILLEKIIAMMLALILIAGFVALGIVAGEANLQHIDLGRALLTALNLSLLTFFFGMVALLISQFTISRSVAAAGASGLLIVFVLLDITGNVVSGSWLQYLSPFYYYNLNRPLIPSFPNTPVAVLLLLGLSLLCIILSLVFFVRRDCGRAVFVWPQRKPINEQRSLKQAKRALSTRSVGLRALSAQGTSAFWWLFSIVLVNIYCLLLALVIQKPFYKVVQDTPYLARLLFDTPTNTNVAMLGTILFTFLPALVIIFAFTLALSWTTDLENGRLELVFSTPKSRPRIMLERLGMHLLFVLLAPALTWLVITIGAGMAGISIDQGRVLAASFSTFPPALVITGLVYLFSGRLRYIAVLGILTAYLVLAFIEELLEGMIVFPSWMLSLSIFHLYGNPIFLGMNWGNFLSMTGVALVLLILGIMQFRVADIGLD